MSERIYPPDRAIALKPTSPDVKHRIISIRHGAINTLRFPCIGADRRQTDRVMAEVMRRLYQLELASDLIDRVCGAAAEAIPNALEFGAPNTPVSMLVVLYGYGPRPLVELIVDNHLQSDEDPTLVDPDDCRPMEELLSETRGRGLAIMRELSSSSDILIQPGRAFWAVLYFS